MITWLFYFIIIKKKNKISGLIWKKFNSVTRPKPTIPLPKDVKTLQKHFVVTYSSPNKHNRDLYFEDKLGGCSLRQKMKKLYAHSLTYRIPYKNVDYVIKEVNSEKQIKLECIQALIKVCIIILFNYLSSLFYVLIL